MDALRARHPGLYQDDRCRLCDAETEDNDSIWTCPETREAQEEVWEAGLDHFPKDSEECQPEPILWKTPRSEDCRAALRRIVRWPSLEDGQQQFTGEDEWTVCHIFRGLVPKALTAQWSTVFEDPSKSIVEHVCRHFCRFIEKEGRKKLWKPRCERTVEWEKQQGITESRKHNKTPTQSDQDEWRQIYGRKPRENGCLCGREMDEREAGRCPGEQSDTRVADQAVIETLLGLRLMDVIEKRGAMKVKVVEDGST
ncbi:hypothetical protein BGX33_006547 [Mortierella sp. NVP41]|nr:hypothetical protein BGX33_006547 [Mortierella sp. NVP41]